jgi:hypothetical protein
VKEIDLTHLIEARSKFTYGIELVKCYFEAQVLIALRDSTLMQLRCLAFDLEEDDQPGATAEWGTTGTLLLSRLFLVMDFAQGGDLRQASLSQEALPKLVLLRIWRELFTGLKYVNLFECIASVAHHALASRDRTTDVHVCSLA